MTEAFDVTDFQFSAFNFKNYTRKKRKQENRTILKDPILRVYMVSRGIVWNNMKQHLKNRLRN